MVEDILRLVLFLSKKELFLKLLQDPENAYIS